MTNIRVAEHIPYMKSSKHTFANWKASGRPMDASNQHYIERKQATQQLRQVLHPGKEQGATDPMRRSCRSNYFKILATPKQNATFD
jgi:hypothetical protein